MHGIERRHDPHGLETILLRDRHGGEAVVYLHGAHVTSWQPSAGGDVLFVSREARFAPGEAIRGGVPVIFPQFADLGPLPKHGFARTTRWAVDETQAQARAGESAPSVTLALEDGDETRAVWPHRFRLALTVSLDQPRTLRMSLAVENTDDRPFEFTAAMHTYLRVGDTRQALVQGLTGCRRRERGSDDVRTEPRERVPIDGPVDRVYLGVDGPIVVNDPAFGRSIELRRTGFPDVVLWNPWMEGARQLADFGDDEYACMLCVEPAVVERPVRLLPGERWTGAQTLRA